MSTSERRVSDPVERRGEGEQKKEKLTDVEIEPFTVLNTTSKVTKYAMLAR